MRRDESSNLARAREAWGSAAPEWIMVLAEACDRASQSAIAVRLGVSSATVNRALVRAYAGRLDRLEARVRGELMGTTVSCPVLGEITRRRCADAQARPYAPTNDLRIELRRACPLCRHYMKEAT